MKKTLEIIGWISCIVLLIGAVYWLYNNDETTSTSPSQTKRDTVQMQLAENAKNEFSVPASKLPEFEFDISDTKFQKIAQSSKENVQELVSASITYQGNTKTDNKVEAEIDLNAEKHKLIVHPKDLPNFKPGRYKLHLTLRTIEGSVNIEQDFTWGVIAVNTDKSIYRPGETANIGFGILNDKGETQCMTGLDKAEVWAEITNPEGKITKLSSADGTIKDSGKCGAITVTNKADFQASYKTTNNGIYKMVVIASINGGEKRSIQDYFKVDSNVKIDLIRYDFPTRIYPGSPYPVAFKVKSADAYSGRIEEMVPKNFSIAGINNNGRVEDAGEFKRIIWDVNLEPNKEIYYSYVIKFPMISPEFYLLGPITLGDFQEARQWQIASDAINSTSGVVTYEDNALSATWARIWSGTGFGSQSNMDTSPADSRWFVEKSSPKTGEKLVAAMDNNNDGNRILYMFRWNGSAWAEDFTVDPGTNWPDANTRYFDIAYEEESGDALFVYGDSSGNSVSYRTKPSGSTTWSTAAVAGTALDSRKKWVRAKAQFGTDNILVGYLNDNERIGALIWDGSTNTFGNQFNDNDTPAQTETTTSDEEAFDIAWETQSATPMIFWGTLANTVMYREFSAGAWQAEGTVYNTGFTGDVEWLSAASDPVSTSNYIALAMQESDSDTTEEVSACEFGVWDGSAGITRPTEVTCRSDFDGRLNTVQFENVGSRAMWVYAPSESGVNGNSTGWRTWTNAGGFTSSTTMSGDVSGNIESIQLHSDLNTTSMIVLTADAAGDLWDREWDGSTWTAPGAGNGGAALHANIQGSGENAEAYGFGFDRNLETMAAYRWFANNNGTSVTTALTAQDASYTLLTANEQFRLRLLLYYPDSLAINGRNYILQFLDPGTGTCANPSGTGSPASWTDVGAPGSGTEISYYNNASPADGDNLTSNGGDPTYGSFTKINQDYEEGTAVSNPLFFTNSVSAMAGDQVGLWDFSLVDNTTYDVNPQTFCFRVSRSNGIILQIDKYPQISTASVNDVLIQSGSLIQSGTLLQ